MNSMQMTSTQITIRPARSGDTEALVAMWRQLAVQHSGYDAERYHWADGAADSWREYLLSLLGKSDVLVMVAADGANRLVGFTVGKLAELPSVFAARQAGSVQDVFVRRECRGRGIGKRLVLTVAECLRELGAEEITLRVAANNREAIAFYEKLGMRAVTQEMYMAFPHRGGAP